MRTLNATQQALVDGAYKKEVSWLFTVVTTGATTYRWSTKAKTFGGYTYLAKVLPESFSGITLNRAKSELRIQAPNALDFQVTNKGHPLTYTAFAGATVTVALVLSNATYADTSILTWKFRVTRCETAYQTLFFFCEDFLQQYLAGDYPKTAKASALSDAAVTAGEPDDDVCVPLIFGTGYVPLRSAYLTADAKRYYILGPSGPTYTVSEVASPKAWKTQSVWTSGSYTFTQYTKTLKGISYRVVEPLIADSDADGVADACGLWKEGDRFLDMPCKFTRSDTSSKTSPADVIQYVLEDMGVPSGDIDAAGTFASAKTTFSGWGLTFNGGLWRKESRAAVLSRLLSMCHAVLDITDKVELRVLSKTSKKTVGPSMVRRDRAAGEGTFRHQPLSASGSDSGYIRHVEAATPQDREQEILVSALAAGTTAAVSRETLDCTWLQDTQRAQRLGTLHFQRLFRANGAVGFEAHTKCCNLQPDDVITIDDSAYGGTYAVLIDRMTLGRDLSVKMEAVRFSEAILDYSDLSPAAVSYVADGRPFWAYEVPFVTVSPVKGEGMFQTIEAALAGLPSWARRIVLLRGTHPAPTSANYYTIPTGANIEIVGESRDDVIVQNKAGYNCFYIGTSVEMVRFANFTIESQNSATNTNMIHLSGGGAANIADILVENMVFDLAHADDNAIFDALRTSGRLRVNNCRFMNGNWGVYSIDSVDVWILNSVFEDMDEPITLLTSSRVASQFKIVNCHFSEFTGRGIDIAGTSSYDVKLIEIINNTFESAVDTALYGIYANYVHSCNILGNIIRMTNADTGSPMGIRMENAEKCGIESNSIFVDNDDSGTVRGCYVVDSSEINVSKNRIELDESGATRYAIGIAFNNGDGCVVAGNLINLVNNRATYDLGIYLPSGSDNNQGGDNVTKNVGTALSDGGSNNAVSGLDEGSAF